MLMAVAASNNKNFVVESEKGKEVKGRYSY
jgi:hypothetical protein